MASRLRRKLFNRPIQPSHPLYPCIDGTCSMVRKELDTGVLNNLVLDHRVSEERERAFTDFCRLEADPDDTLVNLLAKYEDNEIKLKKDPEKRPAYLRDENLKNLRYGSLKVHDDPLDPSTRLVTIKTIRCTVLLAKLDEMSPDASRAFGGTDSSTILDRFSALSRHQQERTLQECLSAQLTQRHGETKRLARPGCVWAAYESDMRKHLKQPASVWWEYLGLLKRESEGIALALSYRVSDASALVTPTQLDAGNYPPHMPPLPGQPSSTLPWGSLCGQAGAREVLLHQEIMEVSRFTILRWERFKFDKSGPTAKELHQARHRRLAHWGRNHREIFRQWLS